MQLKSKNKYNTPTICCFIFILACVFNIQINAQKQLTARIQADSIKARDYFETGNYLQALDEYLKLEKIYPKNNEFKRIMGNCYLNIHDDKSKAIAYLLPSYNKGNYDDELLLDLAIAHQMGYLFDKAIKFYNQYLEKIPAKQKPLINHYIETCEFAKELVKKPVHVTFENLGKNVNTPFADYYPFVSKNEAALYFTSRREESMGSLRSNLGYFSSDIYVSRVKKGEWVKAKNLGTPINTQEDEEIVGLTPDEKNMIIYVDRIEQPSDLLHVEQLKTKNLSKPVQFNSPINTEGVELEGCYTADANTLFFSAIRKSGFGDADIYTAQRLPNGEWGIPKNLGATINTQYKEDFPVISEDGQTLYFASQGHTNMGGFDIFKSKWDEEKQQWGSAVNIGYPVNTPDDDMMFSLAGKGRDGYLSAWRKEGLGDLDIYKVVFLDVEQELTAIRGMVKSADSTKTQIEAQISITDVKTNQELDSKDINKTTGRYIFIVEPGVYKIEITSYGHKPYKEKITILDKSDYTVEFEKNFILLPEK